MSKLTFQERCLLAEQCLPDAPYRAMLEKLHAEMLEALAEQPAQQEPVPCCGKYKTCTQACTPRGRFLGKRDALAEQPAQQALDKMAENARELGLDYEPAQQQEPVAWVYPEGLEALKNGKPWTAYGTKQEANNIALYLHPTPEREPYAWVTFTPYGDEDDVWYENPEGKLLEGWTYKPLYDATPLQSTWVDLTEAEIDEICLGDEAKVRTALQLLKEKNT